MIQYSDNALSIYKRLYFSPNETKPEDVHERVAKAIAQDNNQYLNFKKVLDNKEFRPNSPCLINARPDKDESKTHDNNLAACYVIGLEDTMDSIIQMWTAAAKIYAGGAGLGIPLSNLREKGSKLSGGGTSSGPISYIQTIQSISDTVRSGGKARRAANLTSFKYNHPDILEYIECKDHTNLSAINISVLVSDEFMKSVEKEEWDKEFPLISPNGNIKVGTITVGEVWKKICNQAWRTGDPGLLFYNESNRRHAFPSKGEILATNPCLPKWALVLTPDGYRYFNNVKNNIIYKGLEFKCSDLIKTLDNGSVYEVVLESGLTSYMTLNHKVSTPDKGDKPLEELKPGDLINTDYTNIFKNVKYNYKLVKQAIRDFRDAKDKEKQILACLLNNISYQAGTITAILNNKNGFSTYETNLITIFNFNKSILQLIQVLLTEFGIYSQLSQNKNKNGNILLIEDLESVIDFIKKIEKDVHLTSIFEKLYNKDTNTFNKNLKLQQKIESIKFERNEPVYDITVDSKKHYFVTSGTIVHNCGEVTLPDFSMCNLGSINLVKCIEYKNNKYSFNWNKFKELVHIGNTFLDNVIDKTSYPLPQFNKRMMIERPVGLGIMGLSWTLFLLNMRYGDEESLNFFEKICKTLTLESIRNSIERCKHLESIAIPEKDYNHFIDRLRYFGCNDNDIENFKNYGIRNSTWSVVAPTGSISISADTSYAFEPEMALIWSKKLVDSDTVLYFINPIFEEICKNFGIKLTDELKNKISENKGSCQNINEIPKEIQNIFVTAFDVGWETKVKMQAVGQRWISLAISSTCNLPHEATIEDVHNAYLLAWKSKLKGITIYRDGSIFDQPVNFGGSKEDKKEEDINCCKKIDRPMVRIGKTIELKTPYGTLYITGNMDENGKLIEVFLNLGKQSQITNILLNALGRIISVYLQFGLPLSEITHTLSNCGGEGFFAKLTEEKSEHVDSVIDAISKILQMHFTAVNITNYDELKKTIEITPLGEKCPQCGELTLVHSAGCRGGSCPNCGYSACQ